MSDMQNKHPKLVSVWSLNILTIGGVNTQVNGHRGDALVGPGDAVSLCLDFLPDLIKI